MAVKYEVIRADFCDSRGNLCRIGDVVSLSKTDAKRFNNLGLLRPVVDDEDTAEDDSTNDGKVGDAKTAEKVDPRKQPDL